jgi:hypothetical protein
MRSLCTEKLTVEMPARLASRCTARQAEAAHSSQKMKEEEEERDCC